MSFWVLILLAVVQGLTEFLPISSSGHLVLLYNFFGIENNVKLLSILLHVATLLSVLIYYRKEIIILIKNPLCKTNRKIIVTTIFTCLLLLIIKPFIDKSFNGEFLFVFFIITAILLFISDYMADRREILSRTSNFKSENIKLINNMDITNMPITYKQAIIIGLTQGIACFPGISRSGSTIAVSRIIGAEDSARYSFLISIPIIIGAMLFEILKGGSESVIQVPAISSIIGFFVSFVVAVFSIKLMNKVVHKGSWLGFSIYLFILSLVVLLNQYVFMWI